MAAQELAERKLSGFWRKYFLLYVMQIYRGGPTGPEIIPAEPDPDNTGVGRHIIA